jgi:hypothetical protein
MEPRQLNSGVGIGVAAGVLSWACCISAVVLAFLGLSAASGFMANIQVKYHWWLVGASFLFMDTAIYYLLKHYHGACDIRVIRHNWALICFVVLSALVVYFTIAAISPALEDAAGVPEERINGEDRHGGILHTHKEDTPHDENEPHDEAQEAAEKKLATPSPIVSATPPDALVPADAVTPSPSPAATHNESEEHDESEPHVD